MGWLVACGDGDFTDSTKWATCDANAALDSEASTTTLGTGNTDTSTFVPAAVAIDGVLIKVASRAAGSPSNTITIHLRNSTSGTNSLSLTVNVSDLRACDTSNHDGGWYLFKFGSTHTPNGTDSYLIRATMSATTTAVQLWVSATTNFARMVRTTTTAAPAAADRMIICKEMTAAGTATTRSITMNNTGSSTYGSATGTSTLNATFTNAGIQIGNGGTLTWGNTGGVNYLLKLAGSLVVFNGGTYVMGTGTGSAEIPRNSTAILEFVLTTTNDSRLACCNGSTVTIAGLSRTSGKDVVWCLLNTDEAAAQTVLGVDTDTGWISGDEVCIASSSTTATHGEQRTMNGVSSTTITVSSGLTNAHKGSVSDGVQSEVALLTRNVTIRSDNSARFFGFMAQNTAVVSVKWALFKYCAGGANTLETTTGSLVMDYCAFWEWSQIPLGVTGSSANNFTLTNSTAYSASGSSGFASIPATSGTAWTVSGNVVVRTAANGFTMQDLSGTFTNNRAAGCTNAGFSLSDTTTTIPSTFGGLVAHSCGSGGIAITGSFVNVTVDGFVTWRNNGTGLAINASSAPSPHWNGIVTGIIAFGNSVQGLSFGSHAGSMMIRGAIIAGDTTAAQPIGMLFGTSSMLTGHLRVENSIFGGGGGVKTTHSTRDIHFTGNSQGILQLDLIETDLLSTTDITEGSFAVGSYYRFQSPDGNVANSKAVYSFRGTIAYNTSIVHSPYTVSEHLIPNCSLGSTLYSSPVRMNVENGVAKTVSVYVRKTASYNGSITPRLIVKANPSVGIDADAVLDTMSGPADAWEQLSGTFATPDEDGKLEFVVECNGTGDGVYVSEWGVS